MSLGNSLREARRKSGLSQEAVAEKLGVSRQTVSKWELDETLPDIRQSKRLATLYGMTLDELIDFDAEQDQIERLIERLIERTSERTQERIDWNRVWSKKYPVLAAYRQRVRVEDYAPAIAALLGRLEAEYGYSRLDACLVLKDILANVWKQRGR